MKTVNFYSMLVVIGLLFVQCSGNDGDKTETSGTMTTPALQLSDMDTTVNPAEDFYQYATGGWQKNNPLPAEESRFGTFDILGKETNQKVNDIITGLANKQFDENSIEYKISTFYSLGMDTTKIENDKLAPIAGLLADIDNIADKKMLIEHIAKLHQNGIGTTFNIFGESDSENSDMQILYLYQGGLGLPNRDYYVLDDEQSTNIRNEYAKYVAKIFAAADVDSATATKNAQLILDFETGLARKSMTNLQLRDPFATTNRMSYDDVVKLCGNFDIAAYFKIVGLTDLDTINVCQPDFFAYLSTIADTDLNTWKTYLKWDVLNFAAPYLHKVMADASFDFYGKVLTGALQQQERWRLVVNRTNSCLGEAVGQLFVKEYFPPEAKERMTELVSNLRKAFANRIDSLKWMGEATKQKAKSKLAAITVKIGYPDKWKDYTALRLQTDSYIANIMRANAFEFADMIAKIGRPVDKQEWLMNPQTVNAYYSPNMNEICFPAGILQPPFFNVAADDAVNYGAIGVVIGHEMTHGFDDKGRNYDERGNLNNWWTDDDARLFEEQTQILVDRYNAIEVLPGLHADGELCLGENIADYGGLRISYDALRMALAGSTPAPIDGFTYTQRFYLSYAKIWAANIREQEIRRRTKEDVHSLGRWRVNGQLYGIKDFLDAFAVAPNAPARLPQDKWADIW